MQQEYATHESPSISGTFVSKAPSKYSQLAKTVLTKQSLVSKAATRSSSLSKRPQAVPLQTMFKSDLLSVKEKNQL